MTNPVGRPMKYRKLLEALEDETVYTPATIVNWAEKKGLLNTAQPRALMHRQRLNIRHSLARYSANHFFPDMGDGWVNLKGQPPLRGWLGRRWKADLRR